MRGGRDQVQHPLPEAVGIGEEDGAVEAVGDAAGEGLDAGVGGLRDEAAGGPRDGHHHRVPGPVGVADEVEHGERDRERDPLLDPDQDDDQRGDGGQCQLVAAQPPELTQMTEVDEPDADDEDHGSEGRVGQEVEQGGGGHQDHDGDHRHHQLGELGAPTGGVHHGRLGRAAVDAERAGDAGGQVGDGETDQVAVLREGLLALLGEAAGGGRALGQDHHEDRGGDAGQPGNLAPGDVGKADGREPGLHRPDDGDAVLVEPEGGGHDDRESDHHQGGGDALGHPLEEQDHGHRQDGQHRGGDHDVAEGGQHLPHLVDDVAARVDAEHARQLGERHLHADAGQESDQGGPGEEVGEEAEAEHARHQQVAGGEQRDHPGETDVLGALRLGDADQGREHDRGGRRVGADHEMPRGADQGKDDDRERQGVDAGDHRHPGDLRVAHRLGDGHGRKRRPGDDVGDDGRPGGAVQSLDEGERILPRGGGGGVVGHGARQSTAHRRPPRGTHRAPPVVEPGAGRCAWGSGV